MFGPNFLFLPFSTKDGALSVVLYDDIDMTRRKHLVISQSAMFVGFGRLDRWLSMLIRWSQQQWQPLWKGRRSWTLESNVAICWPTMIGRDCARSLPLHACTPRLVSMHVRIHIVVYSVIVCSISSRNNERASEREWKTDKMSNGR